MVSCPLMDLIAPKLQQLSLDTTNFCVLGESPIFNNSVTNFACRWPEILLDGILLALSSMPNLESINISGGIMYRLLNKPKKVVQLPRLRTFSFSGECEIYIVLLEHITFPPTVTLQIRLSSYRKKYYLTLLSRRIAAKISTPYSSGTNIRSLLISHGTFEKLTGWRRQLRASEIIPDGRKDTDVVLDVPLIGPQPFESILKQILTPLPLSNVHTLYLASGVLFNTSWRAFSDSMPNIRELGISSSGLEDDEVLVLLTVKLQSLDHPAPPPLFPRLEVLLLSGMAWGHDWSDDAPIMLHLLREMLCSRKCSQRMIEELVLKEATDLDDANLENLSGLVGKITRGPDDKQWEYDRKMITNMVVDGWHYHCEGE